MSEFKVGFSRVNINPTLGIGIQGYYKPRFARGILNDIYANAIAYELGDTRIVQIAVDNCGITAVQCREFAEYADDLTGIGADNVFISSTHTHTAPFTKPTEAFPCPDEPILAYAQFLKERVGDAAVMALADLKPAKMGFCVGWAPERVAYIRRYKMKDGSTWTCPPINDPNIDYPIGELDQRVNVLRFDREGGDTIVLMNYGLHADTLNLDLISPDWPGWMSRTFETAVPGTRVVFVAGAAGDVGSTHVHPEGGDMNDTLISFDNEMKSPGMCRFVGRALAGTILQVYDKVEYVDVDEIKILHDIVKTPANTATKEQLETAKKYVKLHEEGKDDEIPFAAMELTTVVAEALRMVRLENGEDHFDLPITGLKLGPVAMLGIPGEPFTGVGVGIKKAEGWKCILPCYLAGGSEGYFPMKEAFDEGGYEARTSSFKGGVAESLIEKGKELLDKLRK